MRKVRFNTYELREICIKHDWFTGGSCEAYDKLFERCRDGADFDELALLIWLCTPNVNRKEIYYQLLVDKAEMRLRELQITVECFDYEAEKESDEELELMIATKKSLEVIANA